MSERAEKGAPSRALVRMGTRSVREEERLSSERDGFDGNCCDAYFS